MFDSKDVPAPLTERIDELMQSPTAVLSVIGTLFAVAVVACAVSHLGSDTRGRPR